MQIGHVNNQQPNFGMIYVKPREWEPQILKTLMNSQLVKEIDTQYPNAKATFNGIGNFLSLEIQLAKNKCATLFHTQDYTPFSKACYSWIHDCQKNINKTTLKDLETDANKKQESLTKKTNINAEINAIFARAEAENDKNEQNFESSKRTPFQKFICKCFAIK